MKYLHTMVRVTDLEASLRFYRDDNISVELLQSGQALEPQAPWVDMPNIGTW